jgi:A/G-specific adenine glycosylase
MSKQLNFSKAVVQWQATHGRHDLPWQLSRDPYGVWLSEIMLQQTQVQTVRVYYERFLARFPHVQALAHAALDEVLALWSGLGYYSRARNLHRCAQQVVHSWGGVFPSTAEQLQTLPGIGPSTAAAVASLCFGERVAILDGNVKRVLSRYLGFEADLSQSSATRALWQQANKMLPKNRADMPAYTQGVMDLGATVCTLRKPDCAQCPVQATCRARALGHMERFPVKTGKLKRSAQSWWLLWAVNPGGEIWLRPQPTPGVWAGLYSFAVFDTAQALQQRLPEALAAQAQHLPAFKHVLTHKDLHLHPVRVTWPDTQPIDAQGAWLSPKRLSQVGLPAPIKKLLQLA